MIEQEYPDVKVSEAVSKEQESLYKILRIDDQETCRGCLRAKDGERDNRGHKKIA
jgi:hypothetical protein